MRILVTIILIALPFVALAQMADDEFCDKLKTFESLSDEDHATLEDWSEQNVDAIFAGVSDALPEGWLRHKLAMRIADCYMTGRGTERDIYKAMVFLQVAARDGHADSSHMLASTQVFQSDDPKLQREGFLTLQREAEAGSAYSAGKVGWAYALGWGVEQDEKRALEHYFRAAKAGMTYWQFLLAHAYEQGYYGLPIDSAQAAYWREFEPKVHIARYDCEIAGNYARGIFPPNDKMHKQYRDSCDKPD